MKAKKKLIKKIEMVTRSINKNTSMHPIFEIYIQDNRNLIEQD